MLNWKDHMKKLLTILLAVFMASFLFSQPVSAADLQLLRIGTTDISNLDLGGTLKAYTYSGGTFELAGVASTSAIVSIVVDDVTKTVTSDSLGNWTSLISSLTSGEHQFDISSDNQTLDFTLTIGSSASSTLTSTTSTSTSSTTLPEAGAVSVSFLTIIGAMLSMGLGLMLSSKKF